MKPPTGEYISEFLSELPSKVPWYVYALISGGEFSAGAYVLIFNHRCHTCGIVGALLWLLLWLWVFALAGLVIGVVILLIVTFGKTRRARKALRMNNAVTTRQSYGHIKTGLIVSVCLVLGLLGWFVELVIVSRIFGMACGIGISCWIPRGLAEDFLVVVLGVITLIVTLMMCQRLLPQAILARKIIIGLVAGTLWTAFVAQFIVNSTMAEIYCYMSHPYPSQTIPNSDIILLMCDHNRSELK